MRKLTVIAVLIVAAVPFAACHATPAAADVARTVTPTVDIEVEDRMPDKSSHVARFSLVMTDGNAALSAHDGELRYELATHTLSASESRFAVKVVRSERGSDAAEIKVESAISAHPNERVLVARMDRADGRSTSIVAQVH